MTIPSRTQFSDSVRATIAESPARLHAKPGGRALALAYGAPDSVAAPSAGALQRRTDLGQNLGSADDAGGAAAAWRLKDGQGRMMAIVPKTSGARIHGQLVGILAREVLGGERAPGDALPNEDDLASRFGVSRSSVREAVKTLSAKGLIESRQRVGARIRPRADWHMLDPDLLAWHPDIRRDRPLVASLLEARRIIEPAAAELAAERATDADLDGIAAAFERMAKASPHDLEACCDADLAFHGGIIAASRNIVLCGLIATIAAALRASFRVTNSVIEDQARAIERHRDVLARLRHHDGPGRARRYGPRARSRRTRPRSGGVVGKAGEEERRRCAIGAAADRPPGARLLGIGPALAGDWADDKDAAKNPQFAKSQAICRALKSVKIPEGDAPDAAQAARLADCSSEALYYGIGRPVDAVAARQCAFVEKKAADPQVDDFGFTGDRSLMTIYANGVGAARNLDVATALACRDGFAQAETDGRVLHLAKLKADHWTGTDFSLCDDITSGMMMGICADHDQLIARSKRNQALADLTSGWTPADRAALAMLQRSRVSLHRCARGERGRSIRHRPRRFRGGGGRQAGAGLFGAVGDDRGGEARLPPPRTTPRRPMRRSTPSTPT